MMVEVSTMVRLRHGEMSNGGMAVIDTVVGAVVQGGEGGGPREDATGIDSLRDGQLAIIPKNLLC